MNFRKRAAIGILIVVVLLSIPIIAMQFTKEVNWGPMDFLMAAILLISTEILFEIIFRKIKSKPLKFMLWIGLFLLLVLIWAELAVGVFGSQCRTL